MDLRIFPTDFIIEFIELYRSMPCLWKIKSNKYSDKVAKGLAYNKLTEKLKEIHKDADRKMVVKKINNLRSVFRKEYKKVLESRRSGAGAEEEYVPRLRYYNQLKFLIDQDEAQPSDSGEEEIEEEIVWEHDERAIPIHEITPDIMTSPSSSILSSSSTQTEPAMHERCLRKRKLSMDDLFVTACMLMQNMQDKDEFDIFGKMVANKLRKLSNEQRIFCEKLIGDVVYAAEMGELSTRSRLVTEYEPSTAPIIAPETEDEPSSTSAFVAD